MPLTGFFWKSYVWDRFVVWVSRTDLNISSPIHQQNHNTVVSISSPNVGLQNDAAKRFLEQYPWSRFQNFFPKHFGTGHIVRFEFFNTNWRIQVLSDLECQCSVWEYKLWYPVQIERCKSYFRSEIWSSVLRFNGLFQFRFQSWDQFKLLR